MSISMIVFAAALVLTCAFLVLKHWENARGTLLLPRVRYALDKHASHMQELLTAGQRDLEKLPPAIVHLSRLWLHYAAVGAGHLAHWLGERAHGLADAVSYKHRFERRELRSEFLKKVTEARNGGLDAAEDTGQNS